MRIVFDYIRLMPPASLSQKLLGDSGVLNLEALRLCNATLGNSWTGVHESWLGQVLGPHPKFHMPNPQSRNLKP